MNTMDFKYFIKWINTDNLTILTNLIKYKMLTKIKIIIFIN